LPEILKNKKIAIVHDYFYVYGGAERSVEVIHEMFPDAPVYTSYFLPSAFPESFSKWNIQESFLGKTSLKNTVLRKFFTLLCPKAIELFDFSDYDIVISSTAGPAKGAITKGKTKHISYIYTPPWFEWGIAKAPLRRKIYLPFMKKWDYRASQRPNKLVAISQVVKQRITQFYNRDSTIIYPPVEISRLQNSLGTQDFTLKEDYFVMGGRLELYKGVSIVAKILDKHGIKLKIMGKGKDAENLTGLSSNIEYLGFVSDEEKALLISKAQAFIMWNEEDFGITLVESLCCGTPIIAYGKGGALDIVQPGINGILFEEQTEQSFLAAIQKLQALDFNYKVVQESANKFSKEVFKKQFYKAIEALVSK